MQHIKPMGKGDPLCPLGFHPQVRWPTRCKRCFRDYKEHGNRSRDNDISLRRDETTVSSPSLSSWTARSRDDSRNTDSFGSRTWTSSSNLNLNLSSSDLSSKKTTEDATTSRFSQAASSWTSSPNLANLKDESSTPTVSFTLPRRRPSVEASQDDPAEFEDFLKDYKRTQYTVRRRVSNSNLTPSSPTTETPSRSFSSRTGSTSTTTSDRVRTSPSPISDRFRTSPSPTPERGKASSTPAERPKSLSTSTTPVSSSDVEFLLKLKSSKPPIPPKKPAQPLPTSKSSSSSSSESEDEDDVSTAGTETTETTIINESELQDQVESLKGELEMMKTRCERVEREKSDILLRRLASLDTTSSKTTASEVLKLQKKVNELQSTVEDLRDDKKSLSLKVRELESDLEKTKEVAVVEKEAEALRAKLHAAETLCEELMDENEDMKKELRDLEEEMDEMQDNFREDQADEYTTLKKELEQTTKNCRILSFKLRKAERKSESLEAEKLEAEKKCRELAGGQTGLDKAERIRHLEQELSVANEVSKRLQTELEETKEKLKSTGNFSDKNISKKKAPMLSVIGKSSSGERMSRETLTRGGSQEDPVQLLRDLQDSMEREADLREQLRFAEEEAQILRKKASRVEDDNESLVLQLKKMATKARTGRKTSPTPSRLTPEPPVEKDEGISDEEDPAELRLLLELNEQEAAVLRRKVEELEGEEEMWKKKIKELQEKLTAKSTSSSRKGLFDSSSTKSNAIHDKTITILEEEMNELRKKLLEKERECERLNTELVLTQKKPKVLQKSKSLDADQQALDLKRQLQVVDQEASVLRTRNQSLESDNEKLLTENKRLLLMQSKKLPQDKLDSKLKIAELEKKLDEANNKLAEKDGKSVTDAKKGEKASMPPEFEKLKKDLTKAEAEKDKLSIALKRLKEESAAEILKFYKQRSPKRPTDITTKLQMKKMVEELENEIGEILTAFKKCNDERMLPGVGTTQNNNLSKFKTEIEDLKTKLEITEKEKNTYLEDKEKLKKLVKTIEEDKTRFDSEITKITSKTELEKKSLRDAKKKVEKEKTDLESKLEKLLSDKSSDKDKEQIKSLNEMIEKLSKELKDEKASSKKLQSQLEKIQSVEKENSKLSKDSGDKTKKIAELEKKFKESEEKLKKFEKLSSMKKEKITKLTKELEEYRKTKAEELESSNNEKETIKKDLGKLEDKIKQLQEDISNKSSLIETLEGNLRKERERATDATVKAGSAASREINQLREELTKSKSTIQDLNGKVSKMESEKHDFERLAKETECKLEKEMKQWETKASDFESELQNSKKSLEKVKATHEKEIKQKDEDIANLKTKSAQAGGKKLTEVKQEYQSKIDKLELALSSEKREYDDLTAKYEQLEEEHVVMKSKLVMDRENVQAQLLKSQQELAAVKEELVSLQHNNESGEKSWKKERSDLEDKIQSLEKKVKDNSDSAETWQLEKKRLNAIAEEKSSIIDQLKKEQQSQLEQIDHMRKELEDYRKQMEDYEKLANLQRNMTAEQAGMDRELKELKNKLQSEERGRKVEVSELKMRYDNRVTVISDELTAAQGQVSRFKRERDTFKHMLEGAQKTISELKASGATSGARTSLTVDDSEEFRGQITALEQQISCMEDELSESRLEGSRLKTELVSERSAWEIKMSEMTSKLNEMEEDRILSGRTKIAGLKSRLELAWQKEREDQHRLLQETSTLARDLRQTLFEVERERDKERLEAKRKLDQLKKTVDEEQDENKKKLTELQSDLLELRDAHAKLRTTNEKLRRDKERFEKERESLKSMTIARRKAELDDDRKVNSLLQLMDELMRLAPDLFPNRPDQPNLGMPTPPARRKGSKSRETSPMVERRTTSKESSPAVLGKSEQIQITLQRLTEATQELRRSQKAAEERDRERARRAFTARRAGSTDSDNSPANLPTGLASKGKGRLYRKSLSLEQTTAMSAAQDQIWKDDREGSFNSIQSLDESMDSKFMSLQRRDPSLDSRLSGGSTQSEIIPSDKKQKKGLFGKLKKLTKSSRSIDHDRDAFSEMDRGSDTSLGSLGTDDARGSKKDLKDRIVDIFKKSGSTSRAESMERNAKPPVPSQASFTSDSTQRPLRAASVTRMSPSPARSDVSQSSSASANPAADSRVKKVPPNSAPLLRKATKK